MVTKTILVMNKIEGLLMLYKHIHDVELEYLYETNFKEFMEEYRNLATTKLHKEISSCIEEAKSLNCVFPTSYIARFLIDIDYLNTKDTVIEFPVEKIKELNSKIVGVIVIAKCLPEHTFIVQEKEYIFNRKTKALINTPYWKSDRYFYNLEAANRRMIIWAKRPETKRRIFDELILKRYRVIET